MADVLIRNIDQETLRRLKEKAKLNNRSLQEELKDLIEMHSGRDHEKTIAMVREIQEKYKRSGTVFTDSAEEISKDRDHR